jgi:hypothetical protein
MFRVDWANRALSEIDPIQIRAQEKKLPNTGFIFGRVSVTLQACRHITGDHEICCKSFVGILPQFASDRLAKACSLFAYSVL